MSHDTLLHRVLRPMVGHLVGRPITPDALTTLRLATGLAAASCFAHGPGALAVGAGLFLVSTLLDRADGELARQSGRFSRIGPNYDLVADCVSTMAIFVGLAIGGAAGPRLGLGIGLALGAAAALSTVILFVLLGRQTPPAGAISRRFDPDDAMLLVPVAIWCGGAFWVLLASGVLTPLAVILVGATHRSTRARAIPLVNAE